MRIALIKDGKVANIVEADSKYRPPAGHIAVEVPVDTAVDIGQTYDGRRFVIPMPSKDELLNHAYMRSRDTQWSFFPAFGVIVYTSDYEMLSRLAARAKSNPTMTIVWPHTPNNKNVMLRATQIVALDEAVTERMLATTRSLAGVIEGVGAGIVTKHPDVDFPPGGIPAWPTRHKQSLKA